eukprot:12924677-Prorocentrum_lima.AAC.1
MNGLAMGRKKEAMTAPTHTLSMNDILDPLNNDNLPTLINTFEPETWTGDGRVSLSTLPAIPP